ncbi:aspartyl/asparaginyl beta-hydroxylase domain-containing protein [Amycolatopsis sp. NBC_01286]|uniref:aspartyl/asparaginyl beta-hydroxylase domain-containing protein n=1 Tax=Amycolatopsis sp. NBC_01286 TaxID=2903560 RepID=UPI002E143D57|nr:aspartyl/asparaginyl beta-hydroxylase domain-containing protein [Amycolatopsis sp. NBC_01286]
MVEMLGRRHRSTWPLPAPEDFPWLAALESEAMAIKSEARRLFDRFAAIDTKAMNPLSVGVTGSWRLVPLVDRTGPYPYLRSTPTTQATLARIPGLRAADFAVLAAGSRIAPHVGNNWGVLRAHLALTVPAGDEACALRFPQHGLDVPWSAGQAFVFDDSFEHDAVNDRAGDRVVLLVEADRPLPRPTATINRLCQRWYRNHPVQRGVRERVLAAYERVCR